MIKKIFLCSDSNIILENIKKQYNSSKISFNKISIFDFPKYKDFNLIVYYFAPIAEKFNIKPTQYEAQLIDTNNKFGLAKYIICGPNFINIEIENLSIDTIQISIEAIFKKIKESVSDLKEDINLGFNFDIFFDDYQQYLKYSDKIKEKIYYLIE